MKQQIHRYDSDNEQVTIRIDDMVIGELREIKVDYLAYVVQTITKIYHRVYNINNIKR